MKAATVFLAALGLCALVAAPARAELCTVRDGTTPSSSLGQHKHCAGHVVSIPASRGLV